MAGFKKKIVVSLITVALGAGVLWVCSGQSAIEGTQLENSESKTGFPFVIDLKSSGKSDYNPNSGELFFRAMIAVLFVVALGVAAVYVSKKILPKITNLPGKEIRIVETAHLGPRKAVHLLDIGNQRFLIGSTNENVTKLAEIATDITSLSAQETNYDREDK